MWPNLSNKMLIVLNKHLKIRVRKTFSHLERTWYYFSPPNYEQNDFAMHIIFCVQISDIHWVEPNYGLMLRWCTFGSNKRSTKEDQRRGFKMISKHIANDANDMDEIGMRFVLENSAFCYEVLAWCEGGCYRNLFCVCVDKFGCGCCMRNSRKIVLRTWKLRKYVRFVFVSTSKFCQPIFFLGVGGGDRVLPTCLFER